MPTPDVDTEILSVPAVEIFVEGTVAVSEVALIKEVVRADPSQFMVDVFVKLVPVAVIVKAVLPAMTELGETELSVGLAGEPLKAVTEKSSKLILFVVPSVLRI